MLRTPTFQQALRKHALSFAFALCLPFLAKADLGITFQMNQDGSQVTADVVVYNFTDIISMQFGMQWDPAELEFVSVSNFNLPGMDQTYFGVSQINDGKLLNLWYDPTGSTGYSLPDCSTIYQIKFNTINGQIPPITIEPSILFIEVYNIQGEIVPLTQNLGCSSLGRVAGNLFRDDNNNCIFDGADFNLEGWTMKFVVDKLPYYAATDANGNYEINCPSGYCEASVVFPADGHNWDACQPVFGFQLAENQELDLSFATHDLGPTENPSGIFDMAENSFAIKVSPNPVKSGQAVFIETTTETARHFTLQIFDTSGRLLHSAQQTVGVGTTHFSVPNSLDAGLYLLKTTDENGHGVATRLLVF